MSLAALARLAAGLALSGAFAASAAAGTIAPVGEGKLRALVIGINAYEHEPTLHGAVADAKDLASALAGTDIDGWIAQHPAKPGQPVVLANPAIAKLTLLLDGAANRAAVTAEMDRLVAESRSGDLAVITYSGHGAQVPEYDFPGWKGLEPGGMNEQFVLGDYDTAGPAAGEIIINKEMKAWLARLDAKGVDVLLVADTCFGGGAVRVFDPRGGEESARGLRSSAVAPAKGGFKPIPMTRQELESKIGDLTHVTFLAGADKFHQVPEVKLPVGSEGRRGALSYSLARVFEGRHAEAGETVVTRDALFTQARRDIGQFTARRQNPDEEPLSDDPAVGAKPVFRLVGAPPPKADVLPDVRLKLAVINGGPAELLPGGVVPSGVDMVDAAEADIVWDLAADDALSHGDVIRRKAQRSELPGILARTRAIAQIKALAEAHPGSVQLASGGKVYTTGGERPKLSVPALQGRDLVILNIASNGLVQLVYPDKNQAPTGPAGTWEAEPPVIEPFGADHVIAVAGPRDSLRAFADWVSAHDQAPAAADVAPKLRDLVAANAAVTIGTADLFTSP